jgi:hypothetical protein
MPANNPLNLAQLHEAILSGLREKLPIPALNIDSYPTLNRRVVLPAVLLELDELEPGEEPATGETPFIGRFKAYAVFDPNQQVADLQVRELAARIVVAIHHEDWGLPIGLAHFMNASADGFKPELDGYIAWSVEWTHEFHLGDVEWPFEDEAGLEIMLGMYPETGTGKESEYWPLGEAPPDDWGEHK